MYEIRSPVKLLPVCWRDGEVRSSELSGEELALCTAAGLREVVVIGRLKGPKEEGKKVSLSEGKSGGTRRRT